MRIFQVATDEHRRHVGELFAEYMGWVNAMIRQEFGISFDVKSKVEQDLVELGQFFPPRGRLLLGEEEGHIAGLACLRSIGEDLGEVKRMYVRPSFRGRGIGKALLEELVAEARRVGYVKLRLDSARFMKAAHAMYRAAGFTEIAPYPESEVPQDWRSNWIFMELPL